MCASSWIDEVVHRAVHRLQVVVLSLLADIAVGVPLFIELHGRVHPVGVPLQVFGCLEELRFGDVWGGYERVTLFQVAPPRVLLHLHLRQRSLGVEDRQARADLVGKAEEIEVDAELAVIPLLGFGEPVQVSPQFVLARPRRPVEPLQLGVRLVATPVRRRSPGQLESVADQLRGRDVRAATQIAPRAGAVPADVVVNGQLAFADLDRSARGFVVTGHAAALEADQLQFVRLVGEFGAGGLVADLPASEALPLVDDLLHDFLEGLQIVRGEGVINVEVVVEPVCYRRADAKPGVGVDLLHGLGHHVGARVAQHIQAVGRADIDAFDDIAVGEGMGQVTQFAVDPGHHDPSFVGKQLCSGRAGVHRSLVSGDGHGEFGRHDGSLESIHARGRAARALPGRLRAPRIDGIHHGWSGTNAMDRRDGGCASFRRIPRVAMRAGRR